MPDLPTTVRPSTLLPVSVHGSSRLTVTHTVCLGTSLAPLFPLHPHQPTHLISYQVIWTQISSPCYHCHQS